MILLDHPHPSQASEFLQILPQRRYLIPYWYRDLRERALCHMTNNKLPSLSEAPEASPLQIAPAVEAAVNCQRPIDLAEARGYDTDDNEDP